MASGASTRNAGKYRWPQHLCGENCLTKKTAVGVSVATAKAKRRKPLSQSRKSAQKRDAIVRAAIEIINTKSYALATMSDIAAALDLRDATLYHYFPDKQALAYACHRRSLERFEHLLHAVDRGGGIGEEKLRLFIRGMLLDSEQHGSLLYFGDYSYLEAPAAGCDFNLGRPIEGSFDQVLKGRHGRRVDRAVRAGNCSESGAWYAYLDGEVGPLN